MGDFGFNLFLDPSRITAGETDAVQEAMAGLETDVNKRYPRTFVLSRLSLTIDEYKQELTLARVPLYVFVSLFVIVIIYFLVLITGLLGRASPKRRRSCEAGVQAWPRLPGHWRWPRRRWPSSRWL